MTIYFYSSREDPYGCFSNFSKHDFELDGNLWKTNEHYFQAQKFTYSDPEWFKKIVDTKNPWDVAKMGRDRSHVLRHDWESVKDGIMRKGLIHRGISSKKYREGTPLGWILNQVQDDKMEKISTRDRHEFPIGSAGATFYKIVALRVILRRGLTLWSRANSRQHVIQIIINNATNIVSLARIAFYKEA